MSMKYIKGDKVKVNFGKPALTGTVVSSYYDEDDNDENYYVIKHDRNCIGILADSDVSRTNKIFPYTISHSVANEGNLERNE